MRYVLLTILAANMMSSVLARAPAPAPVTVPASALVAEGSPKASAETGSEADQAMRCRTVRVTGSLVKKGKVCKTLAEWRRMTESGNDLARRMVEDGTSRPGGQ